MSVYFDERRKADAIEYPAVEGGHVWFRDDEQLVDAWRVEGGFHNGPECARCHDSFCEHCRPEKITEKCPLAGTELPGLGFEASMDVQP